MLSKIHMAEQTKQSRIEDILGLRRNKKVASNGY